MSNELKHSIRLHFPYTFNSNARSTDYKDFLNKICALKINSLVYNTSFLKNNICDSFLDNKIWNSDFCKLDKAIHRYGTKLINGVDNNTNANGFFGMQPVRMTTQALRVLNNGTANSLGHGIKIKLKNAAVRRLAEKNIKAPLEKDSWPLMFNDICFYGLNMGIGIMVVNLSIQQPGKNNLSIKFVEELQEIIYIICRNANNNQSAELQWNDKANSTSKGLSELMAGILPQAIGERIQLRATNDPGNTYAYTTIASNQKLSYAERKTLIFRIARKYSDAYLPVHISEHIQYFEPFEPITHAFSLEGTVSYIDYTSYGEKIPESIENFDKGAIKLAYAPLILLTYAEYLFLREMESNTTEEELVDMRNPTTDNLNGLRSLRSALYDFKLNFRYAQISGNTNHNLFCNYNKKALESDKILKEISSDMQEIEQYISDQVSLKQEARLKKYGFLASLFAVIIGWVEIWGLSLNEILFFQDTVNKQSVAIFLGVLLVLCLIIYLVHKSPVENKKYE